MQLYANNILKHFLVCTAEYITISMCLIQKIKNLALSNSYQILISMVWR